MTAALTQLAGAAHAGLDLAATTPGRMTTSFA